MISLKRSQRRSSSSAAELRVELRPGRLAGLAERVLEVARGEPADDAAEHLQQAPVGIPGKARVVGALGQPADRLVAEAEVEHRVEHPRHRDARPRSDRDQQGIARVAEPLLGRTLEPLEGLVDLLLDSIRQLTVAQVGDAGLRGDHKAGRHPLGPEHAGHLRDPGALAAEQLAHLARAVGEVDDPAQAAATSAGPATTPSS